MIVQGFNSPLVLLLKTDISGMDYFHAQLSDTDGAALKEWSKDDATIDTRTVILPLTQEETAALPGGVRSYVTAIWGADGKPKGGTLGNMICKNVIYTCNLSRQ